MRHGTKSGVTLVEVMVVSTMFFVLMAAVMMVYMTTVRVQRQVDVKSDIDRTLMAAVRHVDSSLRSSRVIQPMRPDAWTEAVPVKTIELKPLKLEADGTPMLTANGRPEWDPPFTIMFDESTKELVRFDTPGQPRVLARLGELGDLSFLRPTKGMLEMHVMIAKQGAQGYQSSREMNFQFCLFNQ